MSFIPARKMPHATAKPGEFDADSGKIVHLTPGQASEETVLDLPRIAWVAGAAGAGLAAAGLAAFLSLRSSSSKTPARRRRARTGTAKTARRRKAEGFGRKKAA